MDALIAEYNSIVDTIMKFGKKLDEFAKKTQSSQQSQLQQIQLPKKKVINHHTDVLITEIHFLERKMDDVYLSFIQGNETTSPVICMTMKEFEQLVKKIMSNDDPDEDVLLNEFNICDE